MVQAELDWPAVCSRPFAPLQPKKRDSASLRKIERARALLDAAGSKAHLQVDGGVTSANAAACVAAGADALVAGSFVFKGGPGAYAANIQALKAA